MEARRRVVSTTATSDFGVSKRENHDATSFYDRFPVPTLLDDETVVRGTNLDVVHCGDSRSMAEVPDNSIALVVTSPPYFAGKAYEAALGEGSVPSSYVEYLTMLRDVFAECWRVLEPGGRIAVNVANLGRKPFRSLTSDVTTILQNDLGFLLRGEIVWIKADGANGNCAWGSFANAANPVVRDLTERIVFASKGRFDRAIKRKKRQRLGLPFENSISSEDFLAATIDTWKFKSQSATRIGHPAPFPIELPRRCIELFTYVGDTVLDPFMGSGQTAIAAMRTGRHYVGYEIDPTYAELCESRLAADSPSTTAVD